MAWAEHPVQRGAAQVDRHPVEGGAAQVDGRPVREGAAPMDEHPVRGQASSGGQTSHVGGTRRPHAAARNFTRLLAVS